MPILGFTANERTARQLTLSWGTTPIHDTNVNHDDDLMNSLVIAARDGGHVRSGDTVAVISGSQHNRAKATDQMRLARVP